jgi:hypothetical protein
MKKLIFIIGIFLLTSCGDKFAPDPYLKESERIAVLEKAKTDTLTTIVEMDKNLYIIKDNKIQAKSSKESETGYAIFFGFVIATFLFITIKLSID